jgi:hypothetical protein
MRCYTHPDREAVGTCKHCFKGVCSSCAKDSQWGIVCSATCEDEVKAVRAIVERNRKMLPMAAKTHMRNAIWLFAMAAVFIGFALVQHEGSFPIFLIALGLIMVLGGVLSILNSRRMQKL